MFTRGIYKSSAPASAAKSLASKAMSALKSVGEVGAAAAKGTRASGAQTVGDVMKLKGLRHIPSAIEQAGGVRKALSTPAGRELFGKGLGKAAPSLGAATAYLYGGKKLYDTAVKDSAPAQDLSAYYY